MNRKSSTLSRKEACKCRFYVLAVTGSMMPLWTHEELATYQRQDSDLEQVIKWLETKTLPKVFPKNPSSYVKALWSKCHSLVMQNKILYHQ